MRLLTKGYGDMDITPDGRYVFFTEAGDLQDEIGRWYMSVYDVDANRIDRLIPTAGIVDGFKPEALFLCEIAATPDGRWLVVGGDLQPFEFVRFNIAEMRFDRYVEMPDAHWLRSFTCRQRL